MKKKEIDQIKNATVEELSKQITQAKKELRDMSFENQVKKAKDTRQKFHLRKKISVLLTILNNERSRRKDRDPDTKSSGKHV